MPRLDLSPRHRALLEALLDELAPGLEVWAYGSRVSGTSHDGSDLDLVLRHPTDLTLPVRNLMALRVAISRSALPILVDILDWARLPESHRAEIEKAHVVLR